MTTEQAAPTRVRPPAPSTSPPSSRVLAVLLGAVGVGAIVVSLLGPLGAGLIEYHVSAGAADQVRGGDAVGLVLVGPVALATAWRAHRGRPGVAALALAPASYGLYLYSQLAIAGDPARYPGTSQRWFPLLAALVVACGATAVLAGIRLVTSPSPPRRARLERVFGWYVVIVAAFLVMGLHLPGLVDVSRSPPTSPEYLADPVVFWVVKLMDLAYVVPVLISVGIGLLRSASWARWALAPVAGWCALLASSVAGMGLTMVATDAPGASTGLAAGFTLAAGVALVLAVIAYRPLVAGPSAGGE